jgi:hypothetical protein
MESHFLEMNQAETRIADYKTADDIPAANIVMLLSVNLYCILLCGSGFLNSLLCLTRI